MKMEDKFWNKGDETESDDDSESFNESFKPSYVVIAIDTHPLMFEQNNEGKMHFRSCLEACYAIADSLITETDKRSWRPFAIMLAGEDTALVNFQNNVLDSVKLLKSKIRQKDEELVKEFQRKAELDLSSFLLSCKKLFRDMKSTFHKRTIVYVTNDDNPVRTKHARFTALNEAKSFVESAISFQVVPTLESFNYKLFYNELFSLLGNPQQTEEICVDSEGLAEKLFKSVILTQNQKKLNFYPFKGDHSRFMKCLLVKLIKSTSLLNTTLTKDGKKIINITGDRVDSSLFRFKIPDNDRAECVKFDGTEKNALLDDLVPKGITLLYVSNRLIDFGHSFANPYLIRKDPKEELPYFQKFWQSCVDRDKVLVCLIKLKDVDKIRYYEFVPVEVDGSPMFLAKRLPYANEITYPSKEEYVEEVSNEKQEQAIQNLVEKLTFDFDIDMIPDVTFRKKKAYVKAKLLDEPMDEVDEITFTAMDSHLKEVVEAVKANFNLGEEKKRKASSQKRGQPQKKNK